MSGCSGLAFETSEPVSRFLMPILINWHVAHGSSLLIFLADDTPGLCRGDQPVAGGLGCAGIPAPAEIKKVVADVEVVLWLNTLERRGYHSVERLREPLCVRMYR